MSEWRPFEPSREACEQASFYKRTHGELSKEGRAKLEELLARYQDTQYPYGTTRL